MKKNILKAIAIYTAVLMLGELLVATLSGCRCNGKADMPDETIDSTLETSPTTTMPKETDKSTTMAPTPTEDVTTMPETSTTSTEEHEVTTTKEAELKELTTSASESRTTTTTTSTKATTPKSTPKPTTRTITTTKSTPKPTTTKKSATTTTTTTTTATTKAKRPFTPANLVAMINEERARVGNSVRVSYGDATQQKIANIRAKELLRLFSHTRPMPCPGCDYCQGEKDCIANERGWIYNTYGGQYAQGSCCISDGGKFYTVEDCLDYIKTSSAHYNQMFKASWTRFAIGEGVRNEYSSSYYFSYGKY